MNRYTHLLKVVMFHSYCRGMYDQSLQRCVASKARFTFKVLKSKDLAWKFAPCHRVSSYPKHLGRRNQCAVAVWFCLKNPGTKNTSWWYTYPSEKYELVGMIIPFPTEWKVINSMVPNHQPEHENFQWRNFHHGNLMPLKVELAGVNLSMFIASDSIGPSGSSQNLVSQNPGAKCH
jgi:hypothetical protein